MDSRSKNQLFLRESPSSRRIVAKKPIYCEKEVLLDPCFSCKKTIKKVAKIATPCTKPQFSGSFAKSQSSVKTKPQKDSKTAKTVKKGENLQLELEEDTNLQFPRNPDAFLVRKLDFSFPAADSHKDSVFCVKISKETSASHEKFMYFRVFSLKTPRFRRKAEVKLEPELSNPWFRSDFPAESKQFSRITLNSFNSFAISQENQLLDLMDSDVRRNLEEETLQRVRARFSAKKAEFLENPSAVSEKTCKKICCNCKKSRCLKLYCECFAAKTVCSGCSCENCANTEENREERQNVIKSTLLRNPIAFKPKVIEQMENEMSLAVFTHAKGCNCQKTACSKKYCECFQAGIQCSDLCKCRDCKNCAVSKEDFRGFFEESAAFPAKNKRKIENSGDIFENFANFKGHCGKFAMNLGFFNGFDEKFAITKKEEPDF